MSTTSPVWDFSCVEDWAGFRHVMGRVVTLAEERNRLTVLRCYDATNRGDMTALAGLVAEDYVEHDPMRGQPQGIEGMRWAHAGLVAAFPDFRFNIDDILAEDDLVFVRGYMEGTHDGPLGTMQPTGRRVRVSGSRLFRLYQDRVGEGWADIDMISLFQQLGAIPAPPVADGAVPPADPPPHDLRVPSRAEAKAVMVRMVEELWNKGDLTVADELFHPRSSSPSAPQLPPGPEGVKAIVTTFRTAFPDYWIRIEQIVASGDRVAARFRQGGTHLGDLMGIPATGKRVEWSEMGVLRLTGGQVAESWYDVDLLGLMTQLGVVPKS
jgi:predicted ester cyclase